nr:ATP-grasp domain-containing protein [Heliobacterium chlorum]
MRVIDITRNKSNTIDFFKQYGVKSPKSYGVGEDDVVEFPCFIKPVSGSSSVNAFKVDNQVELDFFKYYIGDYMIQEFIDGEEYTIDVFCDFSGRLIYATPRIRIATRTGEVVKTQIVTDDYLINRICNIVNVLKPIGPITIQAIRSKRDNEYYFTEINARFGGGCPLSMMAGADSASAVYDLLMGEELATKLNAAQEDSVYLRFDQSIALEQKCDGTYEQV